MSQAQAAQAEIVLVDLASSASAINRAALLACQYMVALVAPDLLSIHGFLGLAPRIEDWRGEWQRIRAANQVASQIGEGIAKPIGYVLREHPVGISDSAIDWLPSVPLAYAQGFHLAGPSGAGDVHRLGTLKWYGSVLPMAEEARKPIFHLKPADGALGAHARVVREARKNFEELAQRIAHATWQSDKPDT